MKGFQNAPHITKFAIGMRIPLGGGRVGTIARVLSSGTGQMIVSQFGTIVFGQCNIKYCELDLTSLWVGREFVEKESRKPAAVVAPPEFTHLGLVHVERDGVITEWIVEAFWEMFEPAEKGRG